MLALGERNTQPISFYASLLKKATVDEAGRNDLPVMKTGFAEKQSKLNMTAQKIHPPLIQLQLWRHIDLIACKDIGSLENSVQWHNFDNE